MNSLIPKIQKITFLLSLTLPLLWCSSSMAADSYELDFQTVVEVDEHAVCRKFYNNNPTGDGIFLSTKTLAEYNSFINNLPAGVKECSCAAEIVGEECWHYGGSDQSCDDVCASFDGYNAATQTYAGSQGPNANCTAVLDALGAPGNGMNTVGGFGSGAGRYAGCHYNAGKPEERRRGTDDTRANDANAGILRACACDF